jgi:hypothetical protein
MGRKIIDTCASGFIAVCSAINPIKIPEAPNPPRGFLVITECSCEKVAEEHAAANEKPRYWFTFSVWTQFTVPKPEEE